MDHEEELDPRIQVNANARRRGKTLRKGRTRLYFFMRNGGPISDDVQKTDKNKQNMCASRKVAKFESRW